MVFGLDDIRFDVMKIIKHTTGVCPKCLTLLPSKIIEEGNKVYLMRSCKEHGDIKTLIWGNAAQYMKFKKMDNEDFIDKKNLFFLEITRRCPLECPTCFNKSSMDTPIKDMSLTEISNIFKKYVNDVEKEPFGIMLCGGEPTIRDDLPDIIQLAKKAGIQQVFLNTNGIRIAEDIAFLKKACDAGLNTIYLQFNDLNKNKQLPTHRTINNFQDKIISNLRSMSLDGTFLVPTVVNGVNDNIIYDIVNFGIERRDIINGISFHCAMHTGEWNNKYSPDRITPYEVMKKIENDSDGNITISDFFPFNYTYPLAKIISYLGGIKLPRFFYSFECGMCTFLIFDKDEHYIPITKLVGMDALQLKLREMLEHITFKEYGKLRLKTYIMKELLKILFNKKIIKGRKARKLLKTFFSFRNIKTERKKIRNQAFLILISQFLDPYNFDMDCNKRCSDDICVIKDGEVYKYPFCYYNIFKRNEIEGT